MLKPPSFAKHPCGTAALTYTYAGSNIANDISQSNNYTPPTNGLVDFSFPTVVSGP